ncbi:MAG: hypothetical protein ACI3YM_07235, partial [Prevotella sp.]
GSAHGYREAVNLIAEQLLSTVPALKIVKKHPSPGNNMADCLVQPKEVCNFAHSLNGETHTYP